MSKKIINKILDWKEEMKKRMGGEASARKDKVSSSSISLTDYLEKKKQKKNRTSYWDDYDDWDYGSRYGSSYYGGSSYYSGGYSLPYRETTRSSYSRPSTSMSSIMGGIYSYCKSYLSKDEQVRFSEVLRESIKLTKEFISILDLPYRVLLTFSSMDSSLSEMKTGKGNERYIFIPSNIFDENEKHSDEKLINTTVGLGVHEASHLLFSDCAVYEDYIKKITSDELKFLKTILFNVIEDERVDNCLMNTRPGYKDFVDAGQDFKSTKAIRFKELSTYHHPNPTAREAIKYFYRCVAEVIYLIYYPSLVDSEFIKENESLFMEVQNTISTPPARTLDSCVLTDRLVNILLEDLKKKQEELGIPGVDLKLSDVFSGSKVGLMSSVTQELLYGQDKDISLDLNDHIRHGLSGLGCIGNSTYLGYDGKVSRKIKSSDFQTEMGTLLGSIEYGTRKEITFKKNIMGDKAAYNKIQRDVEKYVPQIRTKIKQVEKNTEINIFGMRSGLLDTTKLVEAIQGVPQVYYKTAQVKTSKVCVGVLVDESGSMSWTIRDCCGGSEKSRATMAKYSAVLLNEALSSISGVELYLYGHTADQGRASGTVQISVYKEPGYNRPYALSEIRAKSENRDGDAIYEVCKRVRNFTSDPVILFVLSDGCPCAVDYCGYEAIRDTAEKIRKAEALGFEIIQVTISDSFKPEDIKLMFKESIALENDLSELPQKLGAVLRNKILEKKVTTTSL